MIIKSSTPLRITTRAHYHVTPARPSVIPAQAGIHKAIQDLTASRFRLQATGMTGVVSSGMTKLAKNGMTRLGRGLQSGFTLLEMVLVLFLIGLMASATLMLTENVEDQAKYDETKRRMQMMRTAIVGDPTRTVNGGPEISGFVADMGRLPECIAELLRARNCDDDDDLTLWSLDPSTGLGFGWRGPYIQVLSERNGDLRFRDGYGNSDINTAIDSQLSGWVWQLFDVADVSTALITDAKIIRVQSKGFDNSTPYPAGDINDTTPADRPNSLVVSSDWEVELPATVNVTFNNQSGDNLPDLNEDLMLLIYDFGLSLSASSAIVTLGASEAISGIPKTENFTLNATPKIPQGNRAYSVVCDEIYPAGNPVTNDPLDFIIFDGDCESASNVIPSLSTISIFSVVPRQSLNLNLDWIIQ